MRAHILLGLALFPLPALAAPPQLVTDMPVTASLVQQVVGDKGEVQPLLDGGSDPHDFQLRPSQARVLQDAGLLIWMGPEMTVWLNDAAMALGEARQMQLLHHPGTHIRDDSAGDSHDHGADHDHHHDHDHGAIDPHAWLDPDNGKLWLGQIAERLSELDPENATTYRANAAVAAADLTALDAEIAEQLAPARERPFVAFHDAYGYFTDHFALPAAVTVAIGDASAPSAARLKLVQDEIRQSGASCAFAEAGHSDRMIETATEGLSLTMAGEISPTGSKLLAGPTLYRDILRQLSGRISACAEGAE